MDVLNFIKGGSIMIYIVVKGQRIAFEMDTIGNKRLLVLPRVVPSSIHDHVEFVSVGRVVWNAGEEETVVAGVLYEPVEWRNVVWISVSDVGRKKPIIHGPSCAALYQFRCISLRYEEDWIKIVMGGKGAQKASKLFELIPVGLKV